VINPKILAEIKAEMEAAAKRAAQVAAVPAIRRYPVTTDEHTALLHRYLNMIGAIDDDGRAAA
jgi:hypothetical protein